MSASTDNTDNIVIFVPAYIDDLIVWPDGTVAQREDVFRGDYAHMSDDYTVLAQCTPEWFDRCQQEGLF